MDAPQFGFQAPQNPEALLDTLRTVAQDPRAAVKAIVIRTRLGDVTIDPWAPPGQSASEGSDGGKGLSVLGRAILRMLEPHVIVQTIAGDVDVDATP